MAEITEALQPENYTPEASEHWKVDGIRSADWAVRKLAELRAARAERVALVAAETARLQEWLTEEGQKDAPVLAYFEAVLREWHQEQLEVNPKAKTISLPSGKLVARKNPASFRVDPEQFLPWALEHRPEWVRTKVEPAVAAVKKAVDVAYDPETGEAIPGLVIEPGEVKFEVKIEKEQ
jgi:hypothetical protein